MNKTEFIDAVHKYMCRESGYAKVAAERAVEGMIAVISSELSSGRAVVITGFGKFEAKATKARPGRNPKTGEPITIPAGKKVTFKVGAELKEKVNS